MVRRRNRAVRLIEELKLRTNRLQPVYAQLEQISERMAVIQAQIREAEDLVEKTTAEMLVLIEEAKVYVDEDPDRFYVSVEALLNPVIDFPRFARSVMAW